MTFPSLYLLVNLAVLSIPLAFSWHSRLRFVNRWIDFFPAVLLVMSGFIVWDILFTAEGIWGFNEPYLMGSYVAGLPIEEWLFFICIPYACVFTYFSLGDLGLAQLSERTSRLLSVAVLALCIVLAVVYMNRLYTSVTSVFVILFLIAVLVRRPFWIGRLWFSYFVLVFPFILTNGVLTGIRFWDYPILNMRPEAIVDQIVWYNNAHNLAVRIFSIPLDDFLYAFLLMGLNVALFEYFGERRKRLTTQPSATA